MGARGRSLKSGTSGVSGVVTKGAFILTPSNEVSASELDSFDTLALRYCGEHDEKRPKTGESSVSSVSSSSSWLYRSMRPAKVN